MHYIHSSNKFTAKHIDCGEELGSPLAIASSVQAEFGALSADNSSAPTKEDDGRDRIAEQQKFSMLKQEIKFMGVTLWIRRISIMILEKWKVHIPESTVTHDSMVYPGWTANRSGIGTWEMRTNLISGFSCDKEDEEGQGEFLHRTTSCNPKKIREAVYEGETELDATLVNEGYETAKKLCPMQTWSVQKWKSSKWTYSRRTRQIFPWRTWGISLGLWGGTYRDNCWLYI